MSTIILRKRSKHRRTVIAGVLTLMLALIAGMVPLFRSHATTETFTAAGSGTWTVPEGVTSVQIECWGAGGGSGAGDQNNSGGGGGGGGGAYAIVDTFPVSPGEQFGYTVGAGGSGTSGNGGAGGDSTFNSTTCVADGGLGGLTASNGNTGGAGGTTGNSTGSTTYAGGSGANGGATDGGGGGSSAGTASAGANGSGTTGGTAPSGGGDGGDGGVGDGATANPGFAPGGGAGGAGDRSGSGQNGAAGADGQIRLTYTADTVAPTPDPPYFASGGTPNATTSSAIDMTSVTATDATSTPVEYYFTATSSGCTASHNGTGGTDSGWQTDTHYYDDGLQVNKCYGYTVTARDQAENYTATSTASTTYTRAATPGGMTYSSVDVTSFAISNSENGNPASNPTTEFIVFATSTDSNWNEYYVTATGGTSSAEVWLSDSQIDGTTLSGLTGGTRYDFQVVARNNDNIRTATSTLTGTTTLTDTFGPTPDPMTFATAPDDASVSSIDMTASAASDDTPPVEYYFALDNSTCGVDAGTGGTDSGWQSSTGYSDTGLDTNQCYGYTVTARDSLGNANATSGISSAYTAAAVPGAPTISNETDTTFDITNSENGNPATTTFAVYIASSTPADATWEGKYVGPDGDPSATPIWMSDSTITNLTVTGLNFTTTYSVEVVARNGDNDVTASSTRSDGTTTADSTSPTPDPPYFDTNGVPTNDSASAISATSTTLSDLSSVEYYFTATSSSCTAGHFGTGASDSGWQSSRTHTDTGLQPNQCYGYLITGRDTAGNYTGTSTASSTYTSANVPGTLTSAETGEFTMDLKNDANGNPASGPTTEFAVYVVSSTPNDATWVGNYVDGSGDPSATTVWHSDAAIDALTMRGLTASTTYDFEVIARNADNDVTASSTASIATSPEIIEKTRIRGMRLRGMRLSGS